MTRSKRDLLSVLDLTVEEVFEVFKLARDIKREFKNYREIPYLRGKSLAMIFEKPSLRTRTTFELGMYQLGGYAVYFGPNDIQMGKRESVADVAHNLERWFDLIMIRTFAQSVVQELAANAYIPVINALTDELHPCQALTDYFTIWEKRGGAPDALRGFNLTFVGDGFNVATSLMLLSAIIGANFTLACPRNYEPPKSYITRARQIARRSGAQITIVHDPVSAVRKAEAVYTDIWASMGKENEAAERKKHFAPFQVNRALMNKAPKGAWIMHDLPAHRGEEITSEVMDSPQSIIFDQSENRLHLQKGLMVFLDRESGK
ncbi:MAG: ornithine carbamoyltransferase [Candidatus Sumerlaeia bacterium]